jgi:hypothetical protein
MFFQRLYALWRPDMFQGWGRNRRYFEGWYFKIVSADRRTAMAFIPGISFSSDGLERHAFVQVMFGSENRSAYHEFPAGDFLPDKRYFDLQLAGNQFSAAGMRLDLPGIRGTVQFRDTRPWPKMLGAPGIMGWYSFVPTMECFHGIVSLNHALEGALELDGRAVDFTGGRGYIEKDWGISFPRAYAWMQSNHFDSADGASLIASVAHIPWKKSAFIGFISGFWLDGRLYKFATYTGARKHLEIGEDTVSLIYKDTKRELRICAHRAEGAALVSPLSGNMTGKINESLQARLDVELWESGKRLFEDTGHAAGLEIAGQTELITD